MWLGSSALFERIKGGTSSAGLLEQATIMIPYAIHRVLAAWTDVSVLLKDLKPVVCVVTWEIVALCFLLQHPRHYH